MPRKIPSSLDQIKKATPKTELPSSAAEKKQKSRQGKKPIQIWIPGGRKEEIVEVLAKNGYGRFLQTGIVSMLDELLQKDGKAPLK